MVICSFARCLNPDFLLILFIIQEREFLWEGGPIMYSFTEVNHGFFNPSTAIFNFCFTITQQLGDRVKTIAPSLGLISR